MMTPQEFSAKIKEKNPSLQNVDDVELAHKIILAHPELKNQVDFGVIEPKLSTITPEIQKPKGIITKIKESFIKRAEDLGTGYQRQIEGEQNIGSSILQTAGQGAGFTFDIAGEILNKGLESLPNLIKKPVSATINKLADAMVDNETIYEGLNAVNQGIDKYKEWEEKNPEASDNIRSIINLAFLYPAGTAGKIGLGGTGKIAGTAGRTLEESGQTALIAKKQAFVRELVSPVKTKAVKEAQVARTTETGTGIFKKSIIIPTAQELKAENAVMKIEGVAKNKTFQQNYNIIQEANIKAARQLEKDILANDFVVSRKEVISKLNAVKQKLSESPTIVGDAQKTSEKLLEKAIQIVNNNKGSGSGILKARKEYDAWILSEKPKAFDAKAENAFSIANREIRNTLNTILDEKATNVAVKESLSHQSSLYNSLDTIKIKAAQEADSAFGRLLQKTGQILGTKNKIVQGIAAAVGIGGLGAAATFAPAAAIIGGISVLIYSGGKLILNPKLRILLGKLLQETEKILPTIKNKEELNLIKSDIDNLFKYE